MTKSKFTQGYYKPKNPEKYVGDINKIRYMSSWELSTHSFFDNNQRVLKWSSEGICIPYIKPTDGRIHKYIVDYCIEYIDNNGEIHIELVEVKPYAQTKTSKSRNPRTRLYENLTAAVNFAKWEAANRFAASQGWTFRILTEKSIFR